MMRSIAAGFWSVWLGLAPGSVPKPIPMAVEATQLKQMLGLTSVDYTETNHTLAVVDSTLE
jgi:Icc protein